MLPTKDALLCIANLQPDQVVEIVFANGSAAFRVPSIDREFDLKLETLTAYDDPGKASTLIANIFNAFLHVLKSSQLVFVRALDKNSDTLERISEFISKGSYEKIRQTRDARLESVKLHKLVYRIEALPRD